MCFQRNLIKIFAHKIVVSVNLFYTTIILLITFFKINCLFKIFLFLNFLMKRKKMKQSICQKKKTKEIRCLYLVQNFSKKEARFKIKLSKLPVFLSHLLGYIPYIPRVQCFLKRWKKI